MATTALVPCSNCVIQPGNANWILSHGTTGIDFTAYTSFSTFLNGTTCATRSTEITLTTPYFVPKPSTHVVDDFYSALQTLFVNSLDRSCRVGQYDQSDPVPSITSTVPIQKSDLSTLQKSLSSSPSSPAILPLAHSSPLTTTAATTTTTSPSSSPLAQTESPGSTETRKVIIGLVIAIVVFFSIITVAVSFLCAMRKRRKRKEKALNALLTDQAPPRAESDNTQLYFQQKVELDDGQRRHEIEAVNLRYELEGEDRVHELSEAERLGVRERQELRGEEHARELDPTAVPENFF